MTLPKAPDKKVSGGFVLTIVPPKKEEVVDTTAPKIEDVSYILDELVRTKPSGHGYLYTSVEEGWRAARRELLSEVASFGLSQAVESMAVTVMNAVYDLKENKYPFALLGRDIAVESPDKLNILFQMPNKGIQIAVTDVVTLLRLDRQSFVTYSPRIVTIPELLPEISWLLT